MNPLPLQAALLEHVVWRTLPHPRERCPALRLFRVPCQRCAVPPQSVVKRRKRPTSAPALARRRRGPAQPQLPGISDHVDAPYCGCDRCWERDA